MRFVAVVSLLAMACGGPAASAPAKVPDAHTQADPPATPAAAPAKQAAPAYTLPDPVPGKGPENPYSAAQIAQGKKLVTFGSCNDCHTPWSVDPATGQSEPDMARMLSGHPFGAPDPTSNLAPGDIGVIGPTFTSFRLPIGVVYAANLTPDIGTGTGGWTEAQFLNVFHHGKHQGVDAGRGVLPPMPWPWIRTLPDDDLIAIFAYLRSIPPIKNQVPGPKVPAEVIAQVTAGNEKMAAAPEDGKH